MPAVTVDDAVTVPVIRAIDAATSLSRTVVSRTTSTRGFEGEGFPVRRAFAGVDQRLLDPFIHFDELGAVEYAPGEPKGTPWHPHRGFETVTYMIDGVFEHQDSIGGGGLIADGATQWMTAGSGILHIERPPESLVTSGGLFHGLQLWVNLPSAAKMTDPRYQDLTPDQVVLLRSPDGGALVRLIAGALDGHAGPGSTFSPIIYAHTTIATNAQLSLAWPTDYNALVYVMSGTGSVGSDGITLEAGQLAVLGRGDHLLLHATTGMEAILLGGRPIGEPVAWYGPFVMNTQSELRQAMEDFQAGRMGHIPAAER